MTEWMKLLLFFQLVRIFFPILVFIIFVCVKNVKIYKSVFMKCHVKRVNITMDISIIIDKPFSFSIWNIYTIGNCKIKQNVYFLCS